MAIIKKDNVTRLNATIRARPEETTVKMKTESISNVLVVTSVSQYFVAKTQPATLDFVTQQITIVLLVKIAVSA